VHSKRRFAIRLLLALVIFAGAGSAAVATTLAGRTSDVTIPASESAQPNVRGAGHDEPEPPPSASHPNRALIAFLRSPAGMLIGAASVLTAGIATAAGVAWGLGRVPRPTPIRRGWRRARAAPAAAPARPSALLRSLAGALTAGCLLLPLVFSIGFDDVFALPKTGALWILSAVVVVGLVVALVRGFPISRLDVPAGAVVVLAVLAMVATVLGTRPRHALVGEQLQYQGLVSTLAYIGLFFGARFALRAARQVRLVAIALILGSVVVAFYGLAQWFSLDPIWEDLYKDRIFSTVGQANALAATLATATVLAIALLTNIARPRLAALGLVLVPILAAFLLTFSRGGYVALVIGVIAAGLVLLPGVESWVAVRRTMRRFAPAAAGVGLALILAVIFWQPAREIAARVATRTLSIANVTEGSNRAHLDLWAVGVRITVEHPLFGTGPDSYVLVFSKYRDDVLPEDRAAVLAQFRPESPHNVYIAIASGMGIPALAAFLVAVASVLTMAARAARRTLDPTQRFAIASLVGGVSVMLVTNFFITAEPSTSAVFWILLGSLAGMTSTSGLPGETRAAPAR
jgi:O-antigen ligase